jgi:hypothetical protein
MKLNFKQLDKTKKQIQFVEGIYNFEENKNSKWIWTSAKFSGYAKNIEYITLTVVSEMENVLTCDEESVDLKPACLNIVKIKVNDGGLFSLKLNNSYFAVGDNRELGVKIIGISVDNDVIF